jgi:hypothetical protein
MRVMAVSASTLDEVFVDVWRQALLDRTGTVMIAGEAFPVQKMIRKHLLEVDFAFDGRHYRAIEQNPHTQSRWAQRARKGAKVMQFLESGRYLAVVVNGKITHYSRKQS